MLFVQTGRKQIQFPRMYLVADRKHVESKIKINFVVWEEFTVLNKASALNEMQTPPHARTADDAEKLHST